MFKALRDRLRGVAHHLEEELEARLEAELEEQMAEADAEPTGGRATTPAAPSAEPAAEADTRAGGGAAEDPRAAGAPDETAADESEPRPVHSGTATETPREPATPRPATAAPAPTAPRNAPPTAKPRPVTGRKILTDAEIEARLTREVAEAVAVQREVERTAQEAGRARFTINEAVLDDVLWELELGLLESDVAVPVIEAIKGSVREQLLSMAVGGSNPAEVVQKVLRAAVRRVLDVNRLDFDTFIEEKIAAGKKPVVVMFVGVNGTGKTTSIARVAHRLQKNGRSVVMAAGDTFRAGAIEQLSQHADRLGAKIIKHKAGADPAAVAYDAIEHAKARHKDVVLLDTAGRMQTNTNLMDEMDKIRRIAKPDLVVFVGDSLAGNDAVEQARRFDDVVDIDGAILTKVDVDAKGGAALSVAYTINKPLLFLGVGQGYDDLEPFSATKMVDRLFAE